MTVYEVHLSRTPGTVEEPALVSVEVTPGTSYGLGVNPGSLFIRTPDRALAEHVAEVHERTARRSDDRHAWIREVAA